MMPCRHFFLLTVSGLEGDLLQGLLIRTTRIDRVRSMRFYKTFITIDVCT